MIGALVVVFAVVIIIMKKRSDDKFQNMRHVTHDKTTRSEEVYDFVDENMVSVQCFLDEDAP